MPPTFRLQAHSNRFDEADDAWLAQREELVSTLVADGVPVDREMIVEDGDKGAVEAILLTAISAGGLRVCLDAFRAWLGRDRTRWISLTRTVDGVEQTFVLRGRDIDSGQFAAMVEQLIRMTDDAS